MGFFENIGKKNAFADVDAINKFIELHFDQNGCIVFGYYKNVDDLACGLISPVDFEIKSEQALDVVRDSTGYATLSEPMIMDCNGMICMHQKELPEIAESELQHISNEKKMLEKISGYEIFPENNLEAFRLNAIVNNTFPLYMFFQIITNADGSTTSDREFWREQQSKKEPQPEQDWMGTKAKIRAFIGRYSVEKTKIQTSRGSMQVDRMREISGTKSDSALAVVMGATRAVINQWRNENSGLSERILSKASEKLGIDVNILRLVDTSH